MDDMFRNSPEIDSTVVPPRIFRALQGTSRMVMDGRCVKTRHGHMGNRPLQG